MTDQAAPRSNAGEYYVRCAFRNPPSKISKEDCTKLFDLPPRRERCLQANCNSPLRTGVPLQLSTPEPALLPDETVDVSVESAKRPRSGAEILNILESVEKKRQDKKHSYVEIATELHVNPTTLSSWLSLKKTSEEIQKALRDGKITVYVAICIARFPKGLHEHLRKLSLASKVTGVGLSELYYGHKSPHSTFKTRFLENGLSWPDGLDHNGQPLAQPEH